MPSVEGNKGCSINVWKNLRKPLRFDGFLMLIGDPKCFYSRGRNGRTTVGEFEITLFVLYRDVPLEFGVHTLSNSLAREYSRSWKFQHFSPPELQRRQRRMWFQTLPRRFSHRGHDCRWFSGSFRWLWISIPRINWIPLTQTLKIVELLKRPFFKDREMSYCGISMNQWST